LKVFLELLIHRCGSVPWLCARNWCHSMKKRYSTTCSWAASWRRCHSSTITLWNRYDQNLSTSVSHTMVGAFRHSFRTRYIYSRNIYVAALSSTGTGYISWIWHRQQQCENLMSSIL